MIFPPGLADGRRRAATTTRASRRLDSPDRDASRDAARCCRAHARHASRRTPLTFPPPRSRSLIISLTMDDEDPVDPRPDLEEACKPKCAKFVTAYEGCVGRVEKDTTGEAHCTGQYFDMWGCIDKCVAPNLFKHTK